MCECIFGVRPKRPHFSLFCLLFVCVCVCLEWFYSFLGICLELFFQYRMEMREEQNSYASLMLLLLWFYCGPSSEEHARRVILDSLLFHRPKKICSKIVWAFGVCLLSTAMFLLHSIIANFVNLCDKIFEIIFHQTSLWHWSIYCQLLFSSSSLGFVFGVIGFIWFD